MEIFTFNPQVQYIIDKPIPVFLLFPLLTIFFLIFVLAYVIGQRQKTQLNCAYIFFSGALLGVTFVEYRCSCL